MSLQVLALNKSKRDVQPKRALNICLFWRQRAYGESDMSDFCPEPITENSFINLSGNVR